MKSTIDEILKQVNIENIYGKMSKKKIIIIKIY